MTWLAPWALGAGALGMLGIVAAHLLSRQRPRALALATARFLPSGMLEATTLQRIPRDRWWMLLRLLIVALLALGVAQPVLTGSRVPTRTVVLLDRLLPVAAQRAALATLAPTDVVIAFDTMTIVQSPTVAASTVVQQPRSFLSGALGRLVRVRDSLANGTDDLRIAIASPFASASLDPATQTVRALLSDSIVVLPVTIPADSAVTRGPITVRADGDDPVAATALLLGDSVAATSTVIERHDRLTADDSIAATRGATVVHWPARVASGTAAMQALTVGATTWIAVMQRDSSDARASATAAGWWADGAPAVRETPVGTGCILRVSAALPVAGDQSLSLSAQAWLRSLVSLCTPMSRIAGAAPPWLSAAPRRLTRLAAMPTLTSDIAPWLIAAALALGLIELALRTVKRT